MAEAFWAVERSTTAGKRDSDSFSDEEDEEDEVCI